MQNNYIDIFYNHIIKEASIGKIDCFFTYNIRFNTKITETNQEITTKEENPNLLVPTLIIKNKEEFNSLLTEYVNKALEFYDDSNYPEEVLNQNFENNSSISKEKIIMTLLWSNATIEDFNDPCSFLRKRISFFDLTNLEKYINSEVICYSTTLDSNIQIKLVKNKIENETPYSLKINLLNPSTSEIIYELPRIYFGTHKDEAYIYAIQNHKDRITNNNEAKKINRLLYKVNEGLDVNNDNYENYGEGNLKDITPSFLLAANIITGLFKKNKIYKVKVPSILITRWNAKMTVLENYKIKFIKQNKSSEEIQNLINEYEENYIKIQSNLTEKFLRILRRIGYHHSSVMITSYPYELNSQLELSIIDTEDICNNTLLDETYNFNTIRNNTLKGIKNK